MEVDDEYWKLSRVGCYVARNGNGQPSVDICAVTAAEVLQSRDRRTDLVPSWFFVLNVYLL